MNPTQIAALRTEIADAIEAALIARIATGTPVTADDYVDAALSVVQAHCPTLTTVDGESE